MPTPASIACPNPECRQTVSLAGVAAGQTVRCEGCGRTFRTRASSSSGSSRPPAPSSTPKRVGRFTVRSRLGAGVFGTVYRAHDPQLDREVALKVPHPGAPRQPQTPRTLHP
jgi:hypothetical protein